MTDVTKTLNDDDDTLCYGERTHSLHHHDNNCHNYPTPSPPLVTTYHKLSHLICNGIVISHLQCLRSTVMLPYRLRDPVFGSHAENRKRKTDGTLQRVTQGGGPTQVAITQDLKAFQDTFLERIQQQSTNASGDNNHHWESGRAFRIFKESFGSAKIALVHLLLPDSRCDREAYSQIIYAACLDLFRNAMMQPTTSTGSSNHTLLDRACIAIFTLYTLYETNPLLRTEAMTPMDYLTNGFNIRERRAFRQPIRIDQEHFALVLRLQEQCRTRLECCQVQRALSSSCCTCGFARDTITVIERLAPHWDFCEYTGPVGLEAMAGHPDYPYRDVTWLSRKNVRAKKTPAQATTKAISESTIPPPAITVTDPIVATADGANLTQDWDTLANMMKDYQKSIQSIHLGTTKTKLTAQLRNTLEPVLPLDGKISWSEMAAQIAGGMPLKSTAGTTMGNEGQGDNNSNNDEESGQSRLPAEGPKAPGELESPVVMNSCQLVLPDSVSPELQNHLRSAFYELVQRGDFHFSGQAMDDEASLGGDVSTLGAGGISVATGQGRNAIQSLLASAKGPAHVPARVGTSSNQPEPLLALSPAETNQVARFLMTDDYLDDKDAGDDASDISNMSAQSDLDDNTNNEDEATVASSAVGKQALDSLLKKVSKNTKGRQQKPQKRKARATKTATPQSDQSMVSSVGAGRAALDSLLEQANTGSRYHGQTPAVVNYDSKPPARTTSSGQRATRGSKSGQPPKNQRSKPTQRHPGLHLATGRTPDHSSAEVKAGDETSLVSSVGPGGVALGELMKQAGYSPRKPGPNLRITRARAKQSPKHTPDGEIGANDRTEAGMGGEEMRGEGDKSVATSVGPGQNALGALLDHAKRKGRPAKRKRP